MIIVRSIGHNTIRFNKREREIIRDYLTKKIIDSSDATLDNIILSPSIKEDELGLLSEIEWGNKATTKVPSLRHIFKVGSTSKFIDIPLIDIKGSNVRLKDYGTHMVLYCGGDFCKTVFGITGKALDGRTKAWISIDEDKMIVRGYQKELLTEPPKQPISTPQRVLESNEEHYQYRGVLPHAPTNEIEEYGWAVNLLINCPDEFDFHKMTRCKGGAGFDITVVNKITGKIQYAELELQAKDWHKAHTEDMKRGIPCDYVIVWKPFDKIPAELRRAMDVNPEMKIICLYDIARRRLRLR